MESTNAKMEAMKPVFLKAGIPIAVTAVGFIFARFATRKSSVVKVSSAEDQVNSVEADSISRENDRGEGGCSIVESPDSSSLSCIEDDHSSMDISHRNSEENLRRQCKDELEEQILGFRSCLQNLQDRELELEAKYLRYHDMKEQELVLMELQNRVLLDITKVGFLEREISMVELERQRFENMVFEYLRIIDLTEISRTENRLLQRKVKKLLMRTKATSRVIREQRLFLEAKEAEISKNCEELERKTNSIRKMEKEIDELKLTVARLLSDNSELLKEIKLIKKEASSKIEADEATIAEYSRVVCKLEELEKERAVEIKELINLRWCNACLKHELMRRNYEEQDQQVGKEHIELNFGETADLDKDNELDSSTLGHGDPCSGFPTTGHPHAHSKRPKFFKKFKKWMEGCEKTKQKFNEKEKDEINYFERHSVPNGAIDLHTAASKSYSSA